MNSPKKIQAFIVKELGNKLNIDLTQYKLPNFNHLTQGFYEYELNNLYKNLTDF